MTVTEPKQRLVALDVGEVSIVDHPANEAPFVVTKSKSGTVAGQDVIKAMGVSLDPYTATMATINAVRDCVYSLADKLRDPSKLDDAKAEIERINLMLDHASQFSALITKAVTEITAEVTKAKEGGKKMPAFMKEEVAKLAEMVKGMGDEEDVAKALDSSIEAVMKAGKAQFSKERMAKLAEVFNHIGSMYKEADMDGFVKAVGAWQTPAAPAAVAAAPATPAPAAVETAKAGEASVGAQAPAWFSTAIENLAKKVDGATEAAVAVTKRVDAIEKTEAVSKALPHGDGDGKPVQKAENIWKGVV